MKSIMYLDQTGKFPHVSIRGGKYQMVLHNIEINSTWVEALKNRTEGDMILGQTRDLAHMKLFGITPTHQVLDNKSSSAYREAIRKSWMTYQLIPTDKHRQNISKQFNTNMERPFHRSYMWYRSIITHALVVPTYPPSIKTTIISA